MFSCVFSVQKHWNIKTVFSIGRPIQCHFSYTVTFFCIRTNSKLLFLDKVTMNFTKIKKTTDIFKIIIKKMFSSCLREILKILHSLSWKLESNVGIYLSSAFLVTTWKSELQNPSQNQTHKTNTWCWQFSDWSVSLGSVENIEYLYTVEQIIPQSSGGSGLGHRPGT